MVKMYWQPETRQVGRELSSEARAVFARYFDLLADYALLPTFMQGGGVVIGSIEPLLAVIAAEPELAEELRPLVMAIKDHGAIRLRTSAV